MYIESVLNSQKLKETKIAAFENILKKIAFTLFERKIR